MSRSRFSLLLLVVGLTLSLWGLLLPSDSPDLNPLFWIGLAVSGLGLAILALNPNMNLESNRASFLLALSLVVSLRVLEPELRFRTLYGIDIWRHVEYANAIVRTGEAVQIYEGGTGHALLVASSFLSSFVSIPYILVGLAVLSSFATMFVLFSLGTRLSGNARVGTLAALLFVLSDRLQLIGYPLSLVLPLVALALLSVLSLETNTNRRYAWLIVGILSSAMVALSHLYSFYFLVVSVAFIVLGGFARRGLTKILFLTQIGLLFQVLSGQTASAVSDDAFGLVLVAFIPENLPQISAFFLLALFVLWMGRSKISRLRNRFRRMISGRSQAVIGALGGVSAMMFLALISFYPGIFQFSPGKGFAQLVIDNAGRIVLVAFAGAGVVTAFRSPRDVGFFLGLWIAGLGLSMLVASFIFLRLDIMRHIVFVYMPLVLLVALVFSQRHARKGLTVAGTAGFVVLLVMSQSTLVHSAFEPGMTLDRIDPSTEAAASWLATPLRASTGYVGSDIRLSSLVYGMGEMKATYSYVPWVLSDSAVTEDRQSSLALREFESDGIDYILVDKDMIKYGAAFSWWGTTGHAATLLPEASVAKFERQAMFASIYSSNSATIYHVEVERVPTYNPPPPPPSTGENPPPSTSTGLDIIGLLLQVLLGVAGALLTFSIGISAIENLSARRRRRAAGF